MEDMEGAIELNIMRDVIDILIAASVPSALTGFLFWLFKRRLQNKQGAYEKEKEEEKAEAKRLEAARIKNEVITIEMVGAALELCEATAKAVQRIPDAHCNGDMDAALERATEVRNRHSEFITDQGVRGMY